MASYNKFYQFARDVVEGKHDFSNDTFKVLLTNTAPVATNDVKADLVEIAAGNGYAAGGNAAAITVISVLGTVRVSGADVTFTASGAVGPFRYAVLYNATSAPGHLVSWWDYGSSLTLSNTDQFVVLFDDINGIFEVS